MDFLKWSSNPQIKFKHICHKPCSNLSQVMTKNMIYCVYNKKETINNIYTKVLKTRHIF